MNDNSKAHVNDVIKTMLERSSIRAYTDEKLTQEQISLLRNAALSAPTAMNAQDQRFVFVTNAEIIAELEAGVVEAACAGGDAAFAEQLSAKGWFLSSANSINWGRLLPQIVYYFSAYCDYANSGRVNYGDAVDFVVPTGNFGNILACWYAKKMGLPVGKLICASNQNNVLADFFSRGVYDRNRTFYTTISPSMDILISSNLERLLYSVCGSDTEVAGYMAELAGTGRYEVSDAVKAVIGKHFVGGYCSDDETKSAINKVYTENGYLMDTHTAVAYNKLAAYRKDTGCVTPAVVVSTASPYKFCNSVLQALGLESVAPGTELIEMLSVVT